MKFGVHVFPTQHSIQPGELATAVEERGLESLWFSEHTHIPTSYLRSERGASLPDYYWQTYDLFIAMALAAAATKQINIASGVSLVIEHDTILIAKEAATLDVISQGRFIFGVGAGWLQPEMADHGVEYRTRFQLLAEQIQAIREIWSQEEAEFHGRHVNFEKMKSFPKPYQHPHPQILMGGEGERAMACAAEVCDGWAPWFLEWPQGKEKIARLRRMAAGQGRDPGSLEITLFEESIPDQKSLAEMEASGISRLVLTIFAQTREEALPRLDQLAKVNPA